MKRRQAREQALQALFQREFLETLDEEDLPEDPYGRELFRGVEEHRAEIDALIAERAEGWPLERLHSVDRNLLRLAIYELLYEEDVPPEVAIDEAVELAKKYGTERSPAFINGILDRIYKEKLGHRRGESETDSKSQSKSESQAQEQNQGKEPEKEPTP